MFMVGVGNKDRQFGHRPLPTYSC